MRIANNVGREALCAIMDGSYKYLYSDRSERGMTKGRKRKLKYQEMSLVSQKASKSVYFD